MKKIIHVVDYLMPDMGYQEFLLPKWNSKSDKEELDRLAISSGKNARNFYSYESISKRMCDFAKLN